MAATLDSVIETLRNLRDPIAGRDLISAGAIKDLKVENGNVALRLVLLTDAKPILEQMQKQVVEALVVKAGAIDVQIRLDPQPPKKSAAVAADKHGVPGVKHLIAVSSGKGGVGKSTVASNLSLSLARLGYKVGLLDCDIYGPNIPTMLGVTEAMAEARQDEKRGELILPVEARGLQIMSMGILAKGDQPAVWRGPMLHSVISQFLFKVDWQNLDFLIVDMPPGTGDVQLSLAQLAPLAGAVLVTTPQEVSAQDVRKAFLMFEKVGVPVLGIVENMSYFVCEHGSRYEIFGAGAGKALAHKYKSELLAQIPLRAEIRAAADSGQELAGEATQDFIELAKKIAVKVSLSAMQSQTESGAAAVEISGF